MARDFAGNGLPSKLLTVTEVARLLYVHPNTVRRWSDAGLLKTYHIGRRGDRRFAVEDIRGFLQASQRRALEEYAS
jgi:excisionase family DNA binding protein